MDLNELRARVAGREPGLMDATAGYAVLVPLVEREGKFHLLYEVRSAQLRRQPGEVCFPGGRMERGESPEACALRETREELGIKPEDIELMGRLDFIAHRANFIMYPVLARLDSGAVDRLTLNPAEVGETFLVPVDELLSRPSCELDYELSPDLPEDFPYQLLGISRTYRWVKGRENFPVYPWGDKTIWGLTGRITRHLLSLMEERP